MVGFVIIGMKNKEKLEFSYSFWETWVGHLFREWVYYWQFSMLQCGKRNGRRKIICWLIGSICTRHTFKSCLPCGKSTWPRGTEREFERNCIPDMKKRSAWEQYNKNHLLQLQILIFAKNQSLISAFFCNIYPYNLVSSLKSI